MILKVYDTDFIAVTLILHDTNLINGFVAIHGTHYSGTHTQESRPTAKGLLLCYFMILLEVSLSVKMSRWLTRVSACSQTVTSVKTYMVKVLQ